jgi:hypothetical protein
MIRDIEWKMLREREVSKLRKMTHPYPHQGFDILLILRRFSTCSLLPPEHLRCASSKVSIFPPGGRDVGPFAGLNGLPKCNLCRLRSDYTMQSMELDGTSDCRIFSHENEASPGPGFWHRGPGPFQVIHRLSHWGGASKFFQRVAQPSGATVPKFNYK